MSEPQQVYPSEGTFQLKKRMVRAQLYDGSLASAYDILGWVYRSGLTGHVATDTPSAGLHELHVDPATDPVLDNQWVILESNGFRSMSDTDFRAVYEPLLAVTSG